LTIEATREISSSAGHLTYAPIAFLQRINLLTAIVVAHYRNCLKNKFFSQQGHLQRTFGVS
jgi:hypothetical protein